VDRGLAGVHGLDHRALAAPEQRARGIGPARHPDDRVAGDGVAGRGQGFPHLAGVGVAVGRVLGERPLHDRHDRRGHLLCPAPDRLGLVLEDLEQHAVRGVGLERAVLGEQLVEDGAQREDVRAGVRLLAPDLLGRHVVGRPHHRPGLRQLRLAEAGEAEVQDLHAAAGLDVHVARLEVPVHDSPGVREGEPLAQLLHDRELLAEVGGARADQVAQVPALEQLHRHVGEPVLLAEVVDGDDVRVVEPRRRLRLVPEALPEVGVGGERGRDRLDRHVPVEQRVVGPVHLAHRTLADLLDDTVLADTVEIHHRRTTPRGGRRRAPSTPHSQVSLPES
jgi:hypothetical protein